MRKITARVNFTLNNVNYVKNDEIKNLNYYQIVKLNEKGFIEPLKYEDLVLIKRELENKEEK